MADHQSEQFTPVGPMQQLAKVGVFWKPQHSAVPTRQEDGNVGCVIGHGVGHKICQIARVLEGMVIVAVELSNCLVCP